MIGSPARARRLLQHPVMVHDIVCVRVRAFIYVYGRMEVIRRTKDLRGSRRLIYIVLALVTRHAQYT